MSKYSELELRYARPVANGILQDREFRQWLLSGTRHGTTWLDAQPVGAIQGTLRSPGIKNPYWFNYWCGKDSRCSCRIGTGIETDIFLILEGIDQRRLGLHLEIKRPGDTLGDGQAASYPRRAACWTNPATKPRTVIPHQEFLTMLVCDRELETNPDTRFFDKVVFHDEVVERIRPYPEP